MSGRASIEFTVLGVPSPQAPGTTIIKGKSRFRGGISTSLKFWRQRIAQEAQAAVIAQGWELATGPLYLSCIFRLKRPQKLSEPKGRWHTKKPDLKNLVWAVEDSLTGIVYADDKQIVSYGEMHKRYAHEGEQPGVDLEVTNVEGGESDG